MRFATSGTLLRILELSMVSILYYSPKQSENKQRDHNNKAVFEWYTKMCFYDIKSSDSTE